MIQPSPFLLALDLSGKPVLVVGSGEEAIARASALKEAGASVSLVAPAPEAVLQNWAAENNVSLVEREPSEVDLDGMWLVVLADQNAQWAERLGRAASARRVFFCAIDQPKWNSFAHVALARAGALRVGFSSSGRAPALVAALRRELTRLFEEARLSEFVERMAELRERLPPERRAEKLRALAAQIRLTGRLSLPESDCSK
jgi:siroheme synthase-like protein